MAEGRIQRLQNIPFWSDMTGTRCINLIQIKKEADSDRQMAKGATVQSSSMEWWINIAWTQNSVYGYGEVETYPLSSGGCSRNSLDRTTHRHGWWFKCSSGQENWFDFVCLFTRCGHVTATVASQCSLTFSSLGFPFNCSFYLVTICEVISLHFVSTTHRPTTTLMTSIQWKASNIFLPVHLFRRGALPISRQSVRSFHRV